MLIPKYPIKDNYDKKHSMELKNIKTVFVNTRTENSIKTLTPCVTCMHLSIKKMSMCMSILNVVTENFNQYQILKKVLNE